jgi:large subunit ribosomal protein L9
MMETQAASMRKARDVRDSKSREAAEVQRALIEKSSIQIGARAGTNGRLFGSVTESDVVNAIRTATNISLDRHMISMTEHIKELGSTTVTATLFDGVAATVNLEIIPK